MKKIFIVLGLFTLTSCFDNLEKQINKSTNEISDAITRIGTNGEDMTDVLNDLNKRLPEKVKEIIAVDIDRMAKTTVATAGIEFRCNADFLRKRIVLGLRNLQIKLYNRLHKEQKKYEQYPPTICNPIPTALDLNSENKLIQIYGYDYDNKIKVYAVSQQGVKRDISFTINKPSEYLITVTTNQKLLRELENYKELVFEYNNKELSNMSIIPLRPKICDEQSDSDTPTKIDFLAVRCNDEDSEFKGHGPIINSSNRLYPSEDRRSVLCEINFIANEKDGGSCASYHNVFKIYTAKNGYKIKEILSPTVNTVDNFVDSDEEDDDDIGANGFIKEAVYRGDHHGDDIGAYTGATLYFAPLKVTLIECCNNCVEKETLEKLNAEIVSNPKLVKTISAETIQLLKEIK